MEEMKIDKTERLACLYLTFLNSPQGLTFSRIRELMPLAYQGDPESARRKFERDKEELADSGMRLRHFADGEVLPDGRTAIGHLYVPYDEIQKMPELTLSTREARELATVLFQAIEEAKESDTEYAGLLESTALKLLFKNPSAALYTQTGEHPRPALPEEPSDKESEFSRLHEALRQRKLVRFEYPGKKGKEIRIVEGRGMINHRGRWCLVGFSRDANAIRSYYLDRMTGLEILEEKYGPDKNFDIREYSLHPLSVNIHEPLTIRLRLDGDASEHFSDFLSGMPPRLKGEQSDGLFTLVTTNQNALYSWMVRNPGRVTAIGPQEIRDSFRAYLGQMIELHGGES